MANINPYEPAAKARVATAMSASLSFCAERKYLQDIDSENSPFKIYRFFVMDIVYQVTFF